MKWKKNRLRAHREQGMVEALRKSGSDIWATEGKGKRDYS